MKVVLGQLLKNWSATKIYKHTHTLFNILLKGNGEHFKIKTEKNFAM